ncbi:leader peptidase (prepilin peptidase) / N-methyltransferase [Halobacillus dabanensis]|uniref:Leader peptidase (Prepilin peptidase) / N-methyltransferase n=1 Tax=Halobacillus dabanensis TaxID=240302 RepID=A0A1I3P438_HALDA|nr:A24 family peptidase [Halobacillus dabanensis]SFJ16162.1 leader peptidase (prepilin peptidase) / N-methyltransferase [Halobacillus dabanensis]
MYLIIPLYIFVTGIILGSFFNVVGLRLPKRVSFTTSRSSCPHCSISLQARDLIPLFSYVISKGKCRNCQHPISITYPLVEVSTGFFFLLAYIHFGPSLSFAGACLLISLSVIVTVSDLAYMIIPNPLLLFFTICFTIYRILEPLHPWFDSILGALAGLGIILAIILISKGGMGAGDMKLLGVLGILLGFKLTLLTLFLATLIGTVVSLTLIALEIIGRKDPFPFGPFIVLAAMVSYLYGSKFLELYFTTFFM